MQQRVRLVDNGFWQYRRRRRRRRRKSVGQDFGNVVGHSVDRIRNDVVFVIVGVIVVMIMIVVMIVIVIVIVVVFRAVVWMSVTVRMRMGSCKKYNKILITH